MCKGGVVCEGCGACCWEGVVGMACVCVSVCVYGWICEGGDSVCVCVCGGGGL